MLKPLLIGAVAAAVLGAGVGAGLRSPLSMAEDLGPRMRISEPQARAPSAVDAWRPSEGAPPPYMAAADEQAGLDPAYEDPAYNLADAEFVEPPPAPYRPRHGAYPRPEAQIYLPSQRGDILAGREPEPYAPTEDDLPPPETYEGRYASTDRYPPDYPRPDGSDYR